MLVNSGHGVPGVKPSNALHHWENDLRICFEQFDKHFGDNELAFNEFVEALYSFMKR